MVQCAFRYRGDFPQEDANFCFQPVPAFEHSVIHIAANPCAVPFQQLIQELLRVALERSVCSNRTQRKVGDQAKRRCRRRDALKQVEMELGTRSEPFFRDLMRAEAAPVPVRQSSPIC